MATTTNFGWTTPDDTAYVKDGANAMRTLGSAIDTTFADLKGGTTGQIPVKASNSDVDITWIDNEVSANSTITAAFEKATISASAPTGGLNVDLGTASVVYYTSNAAANFTLNFRTSASVALNTTLSIGESVTAVILITTGSTAYYPTAITIDSNAVTPKWQGGTAPTAGNASAIDAYSYTIIKTASATYTVLASQVKFA